MLKHRRPATNKHEALVSAEPTHRFLWQRTALIAAATVILVLSLRILFEVVFLSTPPEPPVSPIQSHFERVTLVLGGTSLAVAFLAVTIALYLRQGLQYQRKTDIRSRPFSFSSEEKRPIEGTRRPPPDWNAFRVERSNRRYANGLEKLLIVLLAGCWSFALCFLIFLIGLRWSASTPSLLHSLPPLPLSEPLVAFSLFVFLTALPGMIFAILVIGEIQRTKKKKKRTPLR